MIVDPLRLAIALVPLGAYGLLIGLLNARRRPFLTSGGCDLVALGLALSGLVFIGPLELFRPEAATRAFGNFIWLFLLVFYGLVVVLVALVARPRLVVYNIGGDELHVVLAEAAARLDPAARWAGNQLALPALGVSLHLEAFERMRNVSLISSGGQQSLEGWRQLASELKPALGKVRGKRNPRAAVLLAASAVLLVASVCNLATHPQELAQAIGELTAF